MGLGDLTIAAAQCASQPGAVERNVETHLLFARAAAEHGVVLLVFPELSLIGYELDLASGHVLGTENAALQPLRQLARESALTLVAGAPVRGEGGVLHVGAFVFQPDGAVAIYTKQHVHSSEEHAFTSGPGGELVSIADARMALAICADASHPQHAAHAASGGANIYAAGVMITEDAYARKAAFMQSYAEEHGMAVLMANYSGVSGGDVSAGGSAIWAEGGVPIACAEGNAECLVIGLRQSGAWAGSVVLL